MSARDGAYTVVEMVTKEPLKVVSGMLTWTLRLLVVAMVAVLVVWGFGATAGALAGTSAPRPGDVAPVIIPSPERP